MDLDYPWSQGLKYALQERGRGTKVKIKMSFSCPNLFSPLTLTPRIIPLCFSSSSYQEKTDVPVDLDLDKYLSFGITCLSIIVTMHCSYEVTDQSVIYKSHIIHTHRHSLLYMQSRKAGNHQILFKLSISPMMAQFLVYHSL